MQPSTTIMLLDLRIAIAEDCMGWFCERYELGNLEFEAKSQIDLIRLVANKLRDIETGEIPPLNLK